MSAMRSLTKEDRFVSMTAKPLVSVVIPTYNRCVKVAEAVDSVLAQDYPDKEVIVVDDGSTDGTGDFLKGKFGDRIRYIYQTNREKSAARNRGIREARGEFVRMLDSDDLLTERSIRAMVECFEKNPDADAVYGLVIWQRSGGKEERMDPAARYPDGDVLNYYIGGGVIHNNSFMVRKSSMLDFGMYSEDLTHYEDNELILRLVSKLKFYSCGTYVCLLRRSKGSAKDEHEKIISQDVKAVDCLFATRGLDPRLLALKGRLYANEYLKVATAAYHAGHHGLFRSYYGKAVDSHKSSLFKGKFLKRYLISLARWG